MIDSLRQLKALLKFTCHASPKRTITITVKGPHRKNSFIVTRQEIVDFYVSRLPAIYRLILAFIYNLSPPFSDFESPVVVDYGRYIEYFAVFLQMIYNRTDVMTRPYFISFFRLSAVLDKIPQWDDFIIPISNLWCESAGSKLACVCWSHEQSAIFACFSQAGIHKISSFMKSLLSQETHEGLLRVSLFRDTKWTHCLEERIQGNPMQVTWHSKTSLVLVGTNTGVHCFSVSFEPQLKLNLIDYVPLPSVNYVAGFDRAARFAVITEQTKLWLYSINAYYLVAAETGLAQAKCAYVWEQHQRILVGCYNGVIMYELEGVKLTRLLFIELPNTPVSILRDSEYFLLVGYEGSTSVLCSIETNREMTVQLSSVLSTPPRTKLQLRLRRDARVIVASYGKVLSIISTHNYPLLAIYSQTSEASIMSIQYYSGADQVMVCQADGVLTFWSFLTVRY